MCLRRKRRSTWSESGAISGAKPTFRWRTTYGKLSHKIIKGVILSDRGLPRAFSSAGNGREGPRFQSAQCIYETAPGLLVPDCLSSPDRASADRFHSPRPSGCGTSPETPPVNSATQRKLEGAPSLPAKRKQDAGRRFSCLLPPASSFQPPHPNAEQHGVRMGQPRDSCWNQELCSLGAFGWATRPPAPTLESKQGQNMLG